MTELGPTFGYTYLYTCLQEIEKREKERRRVKEKKNHARHMTYVNILLNNPVILASAISLRLLPSHDR